MTATGATTGECTAIVVNHNAGELLIKAIGRLLDSPVVGQVRLVDNASSDQSLGRVQRCFTDAITAGRLCILPQALNRGFAHGCNLGAADVSNPFLAFVNPDCLVEVETLPLLVRALADDSQAALAGGWVVNPDGSEQRATRRCLPTPWRVFATVTGLEKLGRRWPATAGWLAGINRNHAPAPRQIQAVEAVSGALMCVRRADFEAVGGFDAGFPLHFEDLDLFARLHQAGKRILLVPAARAVHHQGTCSIDKPLIRRLKRYGLRRYWQKHSRNPLLQAVVWLVPKAQLPE